MASQNANSLSTKIYDALCAFVEDTYDFEEEQTKGIFEDFCSEISQHITGEALLEEGPEGEEVPVININKPSAEDIHTLFKMFAEINDLGDHIDDEDREKMVQIVIKNIPKKEKKKRAIKKKEEEKEEPVAVAAEEEGVVKVPKKGKSTYGNIVTAVSAVVAQLNGKKVRKPVKEEALDYQFTIVKKEDRVFSKSEKAMKVYRESGLEEWDDEKTTIRKIVEACKDCLEEHGSRAGVYIAPVVGMLMDPDEKRWFTQDFVLDEQKGGGEGEGKKKKEKKKKRKQTNGGLGNAYSRFMKTVSGIMNQLKESPDEVDMGDPPVDVVEEEKRHVKSSDKAKEAYSGTDLKSVEQGSTGLPKLISYVMDLPKIYATSVIWGMLTDTTKSSFAPTEEEIEKAKLLSSGEESE